MPCAVLLGVSFGGKLVSVKTKRLQLFADNWEFHGFQFDHFCDAVFAQ